MPTGSAISHSKPVVLIEFERHHLPQFAGVNADVLRELVAAEDEIRAHRDAAALTLLDRAEALQRDTTAARFRANLAGWRASCLFELGRLDDAEAQAGIAMGRYDATPNGRYTLAQVKLARGDTGAAIRLLQEHLVLYPDDTDAMRLLAEAKRRASLPG